MTGWLVRYPRVAPLIVFVLTMLLTGYSVYEIERSEQKRSEVEASMKATELAVAIERRVIANIAFLRAGAALFETLGDVPKPLFKRFVSELRLDENYRGGSGIGWSIAFMPDQAASIEARGRALGVDDYRLWPPPQEALLRRHAILYLEPQTPENLQAMGFNMYSEAVRRKAMDSALRTAKPTVSGIVTLVQDGESSGGPGFLIFMPVYTEDASNLSPAMRSSKLRGFVYSPFRAKQFIDSALLLLPRLGLHFHVYDSQKTEANLLYSTASDVPGSEDSIERPINIAGRTWILSTRPALRGAWSSRGQGTMLAGLAVAILLLLLTRLVISRAEEDRRAFAIQAEQVAIRSTLTRELNHRVKNTLANVISIISLTKRGATDIDNYAEALTGRVRAISATHDILTNSQWAATPLRAVIDAEMAPYFAFEDSRLDITGPDVVLAPNDALSLGLAIHELATNAAKYGALSVPNGRVSITWAREALDKVKIIWQETQGPKVTKPQKSGFGTNLIEKIISYELNSKVALDFLDEGVRCEIIISVRKQSGFTLSQNR